MKPAHHRPSRLQLPASPPATARDDVHEHDQRNDDHRSDCNNGNGRGSHDHADVLSARRARKPMGRLEARGRWQVPPRTTRGIS
jgi:hypothetical protein